MPQDGLRDATATVAEGWQPESGTSEVLEVTPAPFAPGHLLADRYELKEVLGRGGFAFVYRAYDRNLRREVAVKILRSDRLSRSGRDRLRREAVVTRELHTPRLVRVFDLQLEENLAFVTMELVGGGTLKQRLARGPLEIADVVRITGEILEGLVALHQAGVVHRDLKSANVLLDESGAAKLADFGLVTAVENGDPHLTATAAALGTLDYVAPEQALGKPVDGRSDLFSLGVVMFEMLVGRLPFTGASKVGALVARLGRQAPDPRNERAEVPIWLASFVRRLLERDPGDRHRCAEDALRDLRAGRWRLWTRRRIRWAAGLLAICAGGWVLFATGGRQEPDMTSIRPMGRGPHSGVEALDGRSRRLWALPDVPPRVATQAAWVRLQRGAPPVVAAFLAAEDAFGPTESRVLSLLDARNGTELRRIAFPSTEVEFAERFYSDTFKPADLRAVDLDGDGVDEIFATFTHMPLDLAYSVLYEPRRQRTRIVYASIGHHGLRAITDLDGDGADDFVFTGIASELGHGHSIAGVKLVPAVAEPRPQFADNWAGSPELGSEFPLPPLLWYTLIPNGSLAAEAVRVEEARQSLTLRYADRDDVELGFNGVESRAAMPPREAAAASIRAYQAWREARHYAVLGAFEDAQAAAAAGENTARRARADLLADALATLRAQILVRSRRVAEAQGAFIDLMSSSAMPAETAFIAARELHLRGYLGPAVGWYRTSAMAPTIEPKRTREDIALGLVLALCEQGRWNEAEAEVERLRRAWGFRPTEQGWTRRLWQYASWRRGTMGGWRETALLRGSDDSALYLALEYEYASGADPAAVLPRVEREIALSSTTRGPLWSLKAELLGRLGRKEDALDAARRGFEYFRLEAGMDTLARALADLGAERLARAASALGREAEAREARQVAAQLQVRRSAPARVPEL